MLLLLLLREFTISSLSKWRSTYRPIGPIQPQFGCFWWEKIHLLPPGSVIKLVSWEYKAASWRKQFKNIETRRDNFFSSLTLTMWQRECYTSRNIRRLDYSGGTARYKASVKTVLSNNKPTNAYMYRSTTPCDTFLDRPCNAQHFIFDSVPRSWTV